MENNTIQPHFSWITIEPKDYLLNGVVLSPDAELVVAYNIGLLYGKTNTVTVYDYGELEDFFDELKEFYDELQIDLDAQEENNLFPMHYEMFGKNKMLSITKLVNNPVMIIVDLFYQKKGRIYGVHTYLPSDEKHVKLEELCENYPNIRYLVDEINKL